MVALLRSGRVLEGSPGVGGDQRAGEEPQGHLPMLLRFSYVPTKALHRPFKGGAAKDCGGG